MRNDEIRKIFAECLKLAESKNDDYANPQDFYANFRAVESINLPVHIGVYIRFLDKVSRLSNFFGRYISTGKESVKYESIEDTLLDGINYLAICLDTYRRHKAGEDFKKEVIKAEGACVTDNNDIGLEYLNEQTPVRN